MMPTLNIPCTCEESQNLARWWRMYKPCHAFNIRLSIWCVREKTSERCTPMFLKLCAWLNKAWLIMRGTVLSLANVHNQFLCLFCSKEATDDSSAVCFAAFLVTCISSCYIARLSCCTVLNRLVKINISAIKFPILRIYEIHFFWAVVFTVSHCCLWIG